MVYLNFNDLNKKTQKRLIELSREEVTRKYGESIQRYAREHQSDFKKIIEEEALKNLYSYTYIFNI